MRHLAVGLVMLVGCTSRPDAADRTAEFTGTSDDTDGEDCQGRQMLGAAPDALTPDGASFVSFGTQSSNRPGVYVSVVGASLVAKTATGTVLYAGTNPQFVGLRLATASGAEIEIASSAQRSYGVVYALVQQPSGKGYCDGAGPAVPLQGVVEADRFHVATADVSFGCPDGVYHKCQFWGYTAGNDPTSVGWRHHQACMRMANADVFGNGEVHTREDTPIVIRDLIPGANPAPLDEPALSYPDQYPAPPGIPFFEGAWGADRGQGAICLAKHRWLSLPPDEPLHASLPDPRNVDNVPYCNDLTIQQMVNRGALLFNASRRMDMYLNRWRNPSTGGLVTTIRGFYNHDPARREPPFPDYTEYLGVDGVLLRNLTGMLDDADVTAMYVQHNPTTGDYVIATDTPVTAGHVIEAFEGYTLNGDGPDLIPFGLYSLGDDHVSASASGGPGTLGYTFDAPLHHVMRSDSTPISHGARARVSSAESLTCNSPN